MMSHHVTCHVTAVSHASSLFKRKIEEKEKKINIKSEKSKKIKIKIVSVQVSYNKELLHFTHLAPWMWQTPAM